MGKQNNESFVSLVFLWQARMEMENEEFRSNQIEHSMMIQAFTNFANIVLRREIVYMRNKDNAENYENSLVGQVKLYTDFGITVDKFRCTSILRCPSKSNNLVPWFVS